MKHAYLTLPEGYREAYRVDLQSDKKQSLVVTGLSLGLLVAALAVFYVLRPFTLDDLFGATLPQAAVALLGLVVYMVLHEAVHGVLFYAFSGQKPSFGISWKYAYAGSEAYYHRTPYLIIGLAPVVLWGVVLAILAAVLPPEWYWPVQFIQLMNISGAAGDLYVTWRFIHMPADMLVQDAGVRMAVYTRDAA